MPSFDIVSEIEQQELTNAIQNTVRELQNRFDFKGVETSVDREAETVALTAPSDFQVMQMKDIFENQCIKRNIDAQSLAWQEVEVNLARAKLVAKVQEGIEKEAAKKIVKAVKDAKLKVQCAIQGETVRVSGKKRDDLQTTIQFLKEQDFQQPLQFKNFRD